MNNKINKNKIAAIAMLILLAISVKVAADYAQTPLYFTVPMSISFSLFTMGGTWTNSTNSTTVALYPTSETYYFNTTKATNETMVAPCTGGASPTCQTGNADKPGWRIENTGNVNISIGAVLNNTISLSGITMCINSTKKTGCGGYNGITTACTGILSVAQYTTLNATRAALLATQISPIESPAGCHMVNVSVWANFTSAAFGNNAGTTSILFNSSAS